MSAATAWEMATRFRIGKLPQAEDIDVNLSQYLRKQRFEALPIAWNTRSWLAGCRGRTATRSTAC